MKLLLTFLLFAASSFAHQTSQSFLTIHQTATQLEGRWDIALKDLHFALGLDTDQNSEITWGEVRAALPRIDAEAIKSLHLSGASIVPTNHRIEEHLGSTYLVLNWTAKIPEGRLRIDYTFLFDIDPTHRALLNCGGVASTLTSDSHTFDAEAPQNVGFFTQGIWHIWTGYDHVLFLIALLLPAVLNRASLTLTLREVAKVVTAFTVAHSITLSLAACSVILIPGSIVEPIIGFSVLLAAINNLLPMWREKGWLVAFGFGLIHGFGFAGALHELGLPAGSLAKCLLLFNLGVESGQLAIVGLFVPIAFAMRETWFYRGVILRFGSVAISILAGVWVIERLL